MKNDDFIWGDFIDTKICDGLLDFWQCQDILNVEDGAFASKSPKGASCYVSKVSIDVKDSKDCIIPYQINIPIIKEYIKALQKILWRYCDKFPFCEQSQFKLVEPINMQCYPVGGGYKLWHTERTGTSPSTLYRHLVFMTYLNDVPDGGTEWHHQEKYVPAQKGYTVIWPSDWTHMHRGRVSKTSKKQIITGWLSFYD